MSDLSTVAEWLRQREDESDAEWIDRLRHVFEEERRAEIDQADPRDAGLQEIAERAWLRFKAKRRG